MVLVAFVGVDVGAVSALAVAALAALAAVFDAVRFAVGASAEDSRVLVELGSVAVAAGVD
jgi:hypothetical protein